MSIKPAFLSVSSLMNTSPIGVIALYLLSTNVSLLTNFVAHFGMFSIFDKNSKTLSLGTLTTQVSVTEFNILCQNVDLLNGILGTVKE